LDEDDLRALEILIMVSPGRHPVIPETHGLRKLRFTKSDSARGKSGGCRVYYVYLPDYGIVLLLGIIDKKVQSDLTKADRNALGQVIADIKRKLDQGVIR
jgi:hypothetical protein